MTLPSSGAISMGQIRDEFGFGNPFAINSMYGRNSSPTAIPSSGALAFSLFYGKSNVAPVSFTPAGGSYSRTAQGVVNYTLSCSTTALWTYSATGLVTSNLNSGQSGGSITFSLSSAGATPRSGSVTVTGSANGVSASYTLTLQANGNQ